MADAAPAKTGKSIVDPKYRDKYKTPDWLAKILIDSATASKEKVIKEKDPADETKVLTKTVIVPDGVDIDKLFAIGKENGLDLAKYEDQREVHGFTGRFRMTVRNMLQAVVKQRHGLIVGGKFVEAPKEFLAERKAPESPTHEPDGTKIPVVKPPKPEKPAAEAKPDTKKADDKAKAALGAAKKA